MKTDAFDMERAYNLLLGVRNRAGMPPPPPLDEYWRARVAAAAQYLSSRGIVLKNNTEDAMLIADIADHFIDSRDRSGAMPESLARRIRERWLEEGSDE